LSTCTHIIIDKNAGVTKDKLSIKYIYIEEEIQEYPNPSLKITNDTRRLLGEGFIIKQDMC